MPWQTVSVVQLLAGNTIINPNGDFIYDGTPAAGNLMIALAPAAGTDSFANAFIKGVQVGKASDSSQVLLVPGGGGASAVQFPIAGITGGLSNVPNVSGGFVNANLASSLMSGPALTGGLIDDWVQVIMFSNDNSGTFARGELRYIDTSGVAHVLMDWGKSDQAVHIPAGGGPFISAESFHTIGLPGTGGFTGAIRVKKLPWNMIALDFGLKWTNTTGGTFTCGSLPDSTYYPTTATPRRFALGTGGTPTGDAQAGLIVPASGALTVFVNASSAGNTSEFSGGTYTYPTN